MQIVCISRINHFCKGLRSLRSNRESLIAINAVNYCHNMYRCVIEEFGKQVNPARVRVEKREGVRMVVVMVIEYGPAIAILCRRSQGGAYSRSHSHQQKLIVLHNVDLIKYFDDIPVVISNDEDNLAINLVNPFKKRGLSPVDSKISAEYHLVVRNSRTVPVFDKNFIHFLNCIEWTVTIPNDVLIVKMKVGNKILSQLDTYRYRPKEMYRMCVNTNYLNS